MDNIEALERLTRLRESGALTEAEFEQQKAKLLNEEAVVPAPKRSQALIWIGAVVALALVSVAIILFSRRDDAPSNVVAPVVSETAANVTTASATENAVIPVTPPQPAQGSYAWATSSEVLGVTPEFLVSRLGPARERYPGSQTHEVSGCRVHYTIARAAVQSFYTDVTRRCQPSLAGTPAASLHVSPSLSFGQIAAALHRGECEGGPLEGGGNAADPTVDIQVGGSHAENFIVVAFSSNTGFDDAAANALQLWDQEVRRQHGYSLQDSVTDYGPFMCARNPSPAVVALLRRARVNSVTVGTDTGANCQ